MDKLSCLVSDILDCIGYSQDIINVRRNYWQQHAQLRNDQHKIFKFNIAGSKAEGITSLYESDIDNMYLINDAICTNDIQLLPPVPDMTVLHADTSEAPPGYTRLRLVCCNGAVSRCVLQESAFESESRDNYVSSSLFASSLKHGIPDNVTYTCDDLSGPALPTHNEHLSIDQVLAFPCYHSELLQTWKSRRRLHNWPPVDVCEAAVSMLAQVVPVGSKESCDQWREWRFCFIGSELKLTFSLNETQVKLYILLKMVAKGILKNVCREISSYIMKNITFWMSELLPKDAFRQDKLLTLLFLALRFLKSAISNWNWLPYYIIPGRNLLAERLSYDSRRQLSDLIGTLIDEGPRFLLRCNKLQTALTISLSSPATLVDYRNRRNMIEILTYLQRILTLYNADKHITFSVELNISDLVLSDWRLLLCLGIPAEYIEVLHRERLKSILS